MNGDPKAEMRAELEDRVRAQVVQGEPPAARAALERLRTEGHSEAEAYRLMGAALLIEMNAMLREHRGMDAERYAQALAALPRLLRR